MVTYREAEDLINVGAYQRGNNDRIDFAIDHMDEINGFLKQDLNEHTAFDENVTRLMGLIQ
jgi:flagellum-specific ATP synthase